MASWIAGCGRGGGEKVIVMGVWMKGVLREIERWSGASSSRPRFGIRERRGMQQARDGRGGAVSWSEAFQAERSACTEDILVATH